MKEVVKGGGENGLVGCEEGGRPDGRRVMDDSETLSSSSSPAVREGSGVPVFLLVWLFGRGKGQGRKIFDSLHVKALSLSPSH